MHTRMPDARVEEESANEAVSEREETLGEILATQARRASDSLLAGHAIAATLAVVGIAAWRGPLWDVRLSVAVCLMAFGIWGIADRDLRSDASRTRGMVLMLRSARVVSAICGFGALAYLMMSLLGRTLGRIIS
jgi:hypothetical protein